MLLDGHYGTSGTLTSAMIFDSGNGREDGTGAYLKSAVGPVSHEGTVYAVPGASGQTSGGSLNHPAMYVSLNVLGSMILDIDGNQLDATYLDSTGAVRDYFTMIKGGTGNVPPSVAISSPTSGASFIAPADIAINANASDPDGSVDRVDFYAGTTWLGADTTSPYSFQWSSVAVGVYSLTAVATDDGNATRTSAAVPVTVATSGTPVTVSLQNGTAGYSGMIDASCAATTPPPTTAARPLCSVTAVPTTPPRCAGISARFQATRW